MTDDEIIEVANATRTAEPGDNGYVLPISFARAIIAADRAQRQAEQEPVAWRVRYRSTPKMLGHYPWSYTERKPKLPSDTTREVENVYTAPQPAVAPEGYKLVPLEPTQEMCQAGQWKANEWRQFPLRISPIYSAMLAAAPDYPK